VTNDEALKWLERRSAVVMFHESRLVVVVPKKVFTVDVEGEGRIDVLIRDGFTVALSDPGDGLADVVNAARLAWLEKASPVDAIADGTLPNHQHEPAKLVFKGNPDRFFVL
jgi:hypothetical protein